MLENLRAPFKKIINPIARFLVRMHLTADLITIIGAFGTSISIILTAISGHLFIGVLISTLFVLFDSLDGSVAAITTGGTTFGAFLDSTLDRIADWAIMCAVALYFVLHCNLTDIWSIIGIVATMVAMMTSFVTPYARARAESVGYEAKNGIATRSDRILITFVGMGITGLGLPYLVLSIFMVVLAVLGIITICQRIHTVYCQAQESKAFLEK
ncbi:CDP-alcohol phosphatidyltransferase family protein [Alloscardovia theropitheci]|uniref:Phosphatidylinositol phosphate synthase n=1 Tax=Alloscardovia theropitheci TaxID=2496842 RepID=A0A4R0QR14_9BIFI|nr:CDP-alcohol phosphatidyltransferase family protein [Alloscardovia theropitheci]TCD54774.1 CDP-alcohol phosphatidyltransferase family protein [Alloscardovia theropitheci]